MMEDDDLIRMWNAVEVPAVSNAEIMAMTRVENQPVLRRVRRRLVVETGVFVLFLSGYFLFFNDESKGIYMNLLLVTGFVLYIVHDLLVYRFYNRPQKGFNIPNTIRNYRNRLKGMTAMTVLLRGAATFLIICFFSSAMKLNGTSLWALRGLSTTLIMQLVFNLRTWLRRLMHVIHILASYHPINFLVDDDDGPSQGLDKHSRRY